MRCAEFSSTRDPTWWSTLQVPSSMPQIISCTMLMWKVPRPESRSRRIPDPGALYTRVPQASSATPRPIWRMPIRIFPGRSVINSRNSTCIPKLSQRLMSCHKTESAKLFHTLFDLRNSAIRHFWCWRHGRASWGPGCLFPRSNEDADWWQSNPFDFTQNPNVAHAHYLAAIALAKCLKTPPGDDARVGGEAFFITYDEPLYFWGFTRLVWG